MTTNAWHENVNNKSNLRDIKPEEYAERAYRRGFMHGYIQYMQDLETLGLAPLPELTEHFSSTIERWRHKDHRGAYEPAPEYTP